MEYGGSPRSGKGTINEALAELYPGSASDETGLDYRAVVWGMFNDNLIDSSMTAEKVQTIVEGFKVDQLADYAARRYEIIDENGSAAMYSEEINNAVPFLGETDIVRQAVKGGFTKRVKQKVADSEVGVLFVDGRNLGPIIEKVMGAKILLRTFVLCSNTTAANRETAREKNERERKGIPMATIEEEEFRTKVLQSISARRERDENRMIDPAVVDPNALQYWHNQHILDQTARTYAQRYGISLSQARQLTVSGENYYRGGRVGAGNKAFIESRQVVYDTNPLDKDEMIARAHQTLEEAFEASTRL